MTTRSKSAPGAGPSTPPRTPPMTIVIKLGTSSIVEPAPPFLPRLPLLSSIVETVVTLKKQGHRVVLVSSGAIGVGLRTMRLKERGKGLSQKQALAAIGQGRLIALWDNLFAHLDQPIAQILLTRMDIGDRTRYINAQNTFKELLEMGVVPIVNENDTVSVSEIKFGDNDTLSAIAGNVVHADYLFLLTDVDALYTDNPRSNPDAKAVRVVRDIAEVRKQVSTATFGTSLGTGGMSTKIIAAELATAAGVTTVVMNATKVSDIFGIIEGGPGPSREADDASVSHLENGPLCTRFLRHQTALKDRKWWIAHGLHAAGTVVIDEGAYRAIGRRESGGRLLPAGVVRVEGPFASHQAVRIVVRRRKRFPPAPLLTNPISEAPTPARLDDSAPTSADPELLSPIPGALRKAHPLAASTSAVNRSPESTASQPDTPNIQPALSLSSSVASLDPLSRTGPSSPAMKAISERLATVSFATIGATASDDSAQTPAPLADEWEEIEVGKGLAQYNSVEIDRIKGMKSSHIEQVLGYSESEHAVDSIALL
ncbi:Glutamate 5-kinase [Vanrija albida]|uniref:Glutamate 5-kinase n=1 Tax=Vanrija albida TaxID=181172 RepID=A0ABR3QBJ8_9TREE